LLVPATILFAFKIEIKGNKMSNNKSTANNQSNQKNSNKGTSGQNKQHSQAQGNRGKQLNPNQK
jgi:hypothetical protein